MICQAMKGLIEEGEEMIGDIEESTLRDAGLIAAANRVAHYEIVAYGSARAFALTLGLDGAASLCSTRHWKKKKQPTKS